MAPSQCTRRSSGKVFAVNTIIQVIAYYDSTYIAKSDDGMINVHENGICDKEFSAVKVNFVSAIAKVVSGKRKTKFAIAVRKSTVRIRLIFSFGFQKCKIMSVKNMVLKTLFLNVFKNIFSKTYF